MPQSLTQKLNLKPGQKLFLVNPPPGLAEALPGLLADILLVNGLPGENWQSKSAEAVLAFLTRRSEITDLVKIFAALRPDGLAWAAYPKGGSKVATDLNRDILWKLTAPTGWRPVRMVALDETWSAMRFRPEIG